MYKNAKTLFLICETPLHAGSGSELGIVDLPIQRERHTSFPKIEGSSLKGALREAVERAVNSKTFKNRNADDVKIHRVFGYDKGSKGSLTSDQETRLNRNFEKEKKKENEVTEYEIAFSGCLSFTDARLLLFPVKSMKGIFAWVTCLKVLKQFNQDLRLTDQSLKIDGLNDGFLEIDKTYVFSPNTSLKIGDCLILEEYAFEVSNELNGVLTIGDKSVPEWLAQKFFGDDGSYWSEKLKRDIVVLPDDDFKDFVNLSTEVINRTKIDNNTGTVEKGALFTEEYLPAESVMYSLVLSSDEFTKVTKNRTQLKAKEAIEFLGQQLNKTQGVIQIGGSATIGKGIVKTKLIG